MTTIALAIKTGDRQSLATALPDDRLPPATRVGFGVKGDAPLGQQGK